MYEFQGAHPVHGSTTGFNFAVNVKENCWHCFRCNSGGGVLSWLAVREGIIPCDKAQKNALKGEKFKRVLEIAKNIQQEEEPVEPLTYQEWLSIITTQFPEIEPLAIQAASVFAQFKIKDISLPFALIFVDVPATLKTTVISFFEDLDKYVHVSSKFTAASFVSHSAKAKEKDLAKIDLLPKLKGKMWLIKDYSTTFSKKEEILKEEMGILIEVLDGRGYQSDSGVHGHRGYQGEFLFHSIGATTPMPYQIWKVMGTLGHRLHFVYINSKEQTEDEEIQMLKKASYKERLKICKDATQRFISGWLKPREQIDWNRNEDNEAVMRKIIKYSKLMCRLRTVFNIYVGEEMDLSGGLRKTVNYTRPIIEKSGRQTTRLYNHARGHALLNGRTRLTDEDLKVITPIALSSAPEDRILVFAYLISKKGTCTRNDLVEDLKLPPTSAYRTMITFGVLGIADVEKEPSQTTGGIQTASIMKLKKEWRWILDEPLSFTFKQEDVKKIWQKYIDKVHY